MTTELILRGTPTCPHCGHRVIETMPTDACRFFYDCPGCRETLRPTPGDCCVSVPGATRRARRSSSTNPAAVSNPVVAGYGWVTSTICNAVRYDSRVGGRVPHPALLFR